MFAAATIVLFVGIASIDGNLIEAPGGPSRPDLSPGQPNKTVSQRMCEKYAKFVSIEQANTCNQDNAPYIIGGNDVELGDFPHMVRIGHDYIQLGFAPTIVWLCGGSLISELWILSAAHCTPSTSQNGPARWAKMGLVDMHSDDYGAKPVTREIVTRIDHPNYEAARTYHDISLYKLKSEVPLGPNIRPICLQVDDQIAATEAIATGWGRTIDSINAPSSNYLKKVTVPFVDYESCYELYRKIPLWVDESTMICAGRMGKDSCQGDSGGPLQIPMTNFPCTYSQVGVTSFGQGCATQYPGVYTKVSCHVPWIESIVWPGQ